MRFRLPFASLAFILAVTACSSRDPVANDANGAALPAPAEDTAHDPTEAPPDTPGQQATAAATAGGVIPAALQGRWGLTPADCTSTRGDAKGLLTIGPEELRFYESRAVPAAGISSDRNSVSGDFNFTGEGQTWTKFQALTVKGDKLVRTETSPSASFTYAKC